MSRVLVTGVSLISCLGDKDDTWAKITGGISGIKTAQPFPSLSPLPLGLINSSPASVTDLTFKLIHQLCDDAGLYPPLKDIAVVVGSSRGCQSQWESLLSTYDFASWLNSFPHEIALVVARYLQTSYIILSPMNSCATGLSAIAQGYELIKRGDCSQVVVGAVECPITPLTIVGFKQMKALSDRGCYPFAKDRDGFVLGEGGGLLLLEKEESALQRQATIYGEILGWGMTCDGEGITAPEKAGLAGIKAIKICLEGCQLLPSDIDYIHGHGTGTILNDQREAHIIQSLFPHFPLVSSTKWATAHCLGASGAISMVLNCFALSNQKSIPNRVNSTSNFALNLCQESINYHLDKILSLSFGFGGQNIVICMGKYL